MFQHKYSMSPLAWLEQRASVMRPTVFPNLEDTREASKEAGFPMTVSVGHTFVTKPSMQLENWVITTICREYTSIRDAKGFPPIAIIDANTYRTEGGVSRSRSIHCRSNTLFLGWPTSQTRDTAFGRKYKLNEYVHQFTDGA